MNGYTITDWQRLYENSETRKLKSLKWVALPNKHDGLGFRLMTREKDYAKLFAAWILIVQIASRAELKEERGTLIRGGRAMTPDDLEAMTGFEASMFVRAFSFFSSPRVNWITIVPCEESPGESGEFPGMPGDSPGYPGSFPVEGKGREGKGKKEEGEVLMSFPTKDGEWHLRGAFADRLIEEFPGVDVKYQCGKAVNWLNKKKANLKTRSGMQLFLQNWMEKASPNTRQPASATDHFANMYPQEQMIPLGES